MEERHAISRATELGPHLLQPTCRRQRQTNVHILRPTYRMNRNGYEHILDLGLSSKDPPFHAPRSRNNGFNSPAEPQLDLRRDGKDIGSLLRHQEHNSRTQSRTPPSDDLSPGSSSDDHGPPSWSRTHFKLDCPIPAGSPPLPPFFRRSSRNNAQSASDYPSSLGLLDFLHHDNGSRWPNDNQRKSCEYCRFRKKKCSGHNTCILCFRIGVDCVYMPDLIAQRIADGSDAPSLSPGSHFPYPTSSGSGAEGSMRFETSQPPYGDPTSSVLDDDPMETPTQLSGRETKRRKRAANGKPGPTKRQKKSRARRDPTRSVASDIDQSTPRGNGPNPTASDLGSAYVELALNLAGRVFGMATMDMDSQETEPQCVSFDVLDRTIHVMSVPKRSDTTEPKDVFGDTPTTQQGYTEDNIHISQPTSITMFEWVPQLVSLTAPGTGGMETVSASKFDIFPLSVAGPSLEPLMDSPMSPSSSPSIPPTLSDPPVLPDIANDHDPTVSWTADDWLAWYASIFPSVTTAIHTYPQGAECFTSDRV